MNGQRALRRQNVQLRQAILPRAASADGMLIILLPLPFDSAADRLPGTSTYGLPE